MLAPALRVVNRESVSCCHALSRLRLESFHSCPIFKLYAFLALGWRRTACNVICTDDGDSFENSRDG